MRRWLKNIPGQGNELAPILLLNALAIEKHVDPFRYAQTEEGDQAKAGHIPVRKHGTRIYCGSNF